MLGQWFNRNLGSRLLLPLIKDDKRRVFFERNAKKQTLLFVCIRFFYEREQKMASFRIEALLLFAFFVIFGGVKGAAFQQSDYNQRPSVWSAKMSPLERLSLWRKDEKHSFHVDSVKGCCMSLTWAATVFTYTASEEGGKKQNTSERDVISNDPANNRFADDCTIGNVTASFIILCDGSGATVYLFSKTQQSCTKDRIPDCPIGPDPVCFPSNGSLVGTYNFGAGSGALRTQLWGYKSGDSQDGASMGVLLTPDDCVPIIVAHDSKDSTVKESHFMESVFTNFTTNIPDPDVFTPPSYCNGEGVGGDKTQPGFFDVTALFKRFASFR